MKKTLQDAFKSTVVPQFVFEPLDEPFGKDIIIMVPSVSYTDLRAMILKI